MKTLIKSIALIFVLFLVSDCASIVSHSSWPLTVNTNPAGAKVVITDITGVEVFNGTSPATMNLKSGAGYFVKQSYKVKLTMDNYPEKVIPVECTLNGWYIANIFIGGLIGWLIVDPITGAMYRLDREVINVDLSSSGLLEKPALQVIDINSLPSEFKDHLIRVDK